MSQAFYESQLLPHASTAGQGVSAGSRLGAGAGLLFLPVERDHRAARSPEEARLAAEIVELAETFGFSLARVNGSHHIFVHPALPELLNLQEVNGKAKPYQVRQLLRLIERYNLALKDSG